MKKLVIIEENLRFINAVKLMIKLNEKKDGCNYYYAKGRIKDPGVKHPRKYRYITNYAVYCYIDE